MHFLQLFHERLFVCLVSLRIFVYTKNNEIKTKSVDSDVVNNVVAALLTKFRKEK